MRIVYLADFRPFPNLVRSEEYVADGLEQLGHEVVRHQIEPYEDQVRLQIPALEPDVVLVSHARKMPEHWIEALPRENPNALIVQWLFDYLRDPGLERKWFLPRAKAWDLSFLKDRERFAYYRSLGIDCHWLHQGTPPNLPFAEETDPAHECDVAFLGNPRLHHPFRPAVLRRLLREGLDLHVYTNPVFFRRWRWLGVRRELFSNLHDAEMRPVCATAKVILGLGCFKKEWDGYWSSRPYLTLGSGGFFVTQYVSGMEEHFENGKHLVWWKDLDEGVELIRHYIERPEERERIRRAGFEHVHAHHRYVDRCRILADVCEDRLARLRGGGLRRAAPVPARDSWRKPLEAAARLLGNRRSDSRSGGNQ